MNKNANSADVRDASTKAQERRISQPRMSLLMRL